MKRIQLFIILHLFLMIYSVGGILSKLAAGEPFMSLPFILLYVGEILILAFYAIGWQQFIKRMPLSVAYANKAVTVVWGCVWGMVIFHEHLTPGKIVGALLVLAGVAMYGYADGKMSAVVAGGDVEKKIDGKQGKQQPVDRQGEQYTDRQEDQFVDNEGKHSPDDQRDGG